MRNACLLSIVFVCAPEFAAYGQQPQAAKLGSVAGQVVNLTTGEGVRKSTVTLSPSQSLAVPQRAGQGRLLHTAETNATGHFRIDGVEPGEYRLSATRTGFVRDDMRTRGRGRPQGQVITVSEGREASAVVKLTPQVVVTGRVVDQDNDPIEGASVQILSFRYSNGKKRLLPVAHSMTNDLGEFRAAGLSPGRFYIGATKMPMGDFRFADRTGRGPSAVIGEETGFSPSYFPGVDNLASASPLNLHAGEQAPNLEFRLQKSVVHRIRGKVQGLGQPEGRGGMPAGMVFLYPAGDESGVRENRPWPVRGDGSFEVAGVRPGRYTLLANQSLRGQQRSGTVTVDVGAGDVEGVTISVQEGHPVSGTVKTEGEAPPALSSVRVQLLPQHDFYFSSPVAPVLDDGTFTTPLIESARYRVALMGAPENYYVKAVKVGGREMEDAMIETTGPVNDLEIVLGAGTATVQGVVKNSKGEPVADSAVTLVPEGKLAAWSELYREASTDAAGNFSLAGVRPGSYRAYAWAELESGAQQDPTFLKPHEGSSVAVKAEANGAHSIELKQIEPQ